MTHSRLLVPYLQMLEGCIQATNPQTFPSPMRPEYKARMEEKMFFFFYGVPAAPIFLSGCSTIQASHCCVCLIAVCL